MTHGAPAPPCRVTLAGIGDEMRHDDGIGPVIARRAARLSSGRGSGFVTAVASPSDQPLDLLDDWDGDDLAIVVDAVRSGAPPGTVTLTWLERLGDVVLPTGCGRASTHGLAVADVLRLACEIGLAPQRVALVGVEGQDFSEGEGLTAPVEAGADRAVDLVVKLAQSVWDGAA